MSNKEAIVMIAVVVCLCIFCAVGGYYTGKNSIEKRADSIGQPSFIAAEELSKSIVTIEVLKDELPYITVGEDGMKYYVKMVNNYDRSILTNNGDVLEIGDEFCFDTSSCDDEYNKTFTATYIDKPFLYAHITSPPSSIDNKLYRFMAFDRRIVELSDIEKSFFEISSKE